jgi:ABC transporter substrate binding protein
VFATGDDPVKVGLVAGLNRPGGNITGISFFNSAELESKQLELLREVVPKAGLIGVLVNPSATAAESQESEARSAARRSRGRLPRTRSSRRHRRGVLGSCSWDCHPTAKRRSTSGGDYGTRGTPRDAMW